MRAKEKTKQQNIIVIYRPYRFHNMRYIIASFSLNKNINYRVRWSI